MWFCKCKHFAKLGCYSKGLCKIQSHVPLPQSPKKATSFLNMDRPVHKESDRGLSKRLLHSSRTLFPFLWIEKNHSWSASDSSSCYFLKNLPLSSGEISHPHSPHARAFDLILNYLHWKAVPISQPGLQLKNTVGADLEGKSLWKDLNRKDLGVSQGLQNFRQNSFSKELSRVLAHLNPEL